MRHAVLTVVFVLCLTWTALAEEATNHCQDPATWADWEAKAAQYPHDTEFQRLHTVWKRLCGKVEAGDLSLEDAMSIFEQAREQAIEHHRKEQHAPQSPPSP
jgi:exonuclease VII small subunit